MSRAEAMAQPMWRVESIKPNFIETAYYRDEAKAFEAYRLACEGGGARPRVRLQKRDAHRSRFVTLMAIDWF